MNYCQSETLSDGTFLCTPTSTPEQKRFSWVLLAIERFACVEKMFIPVSWTAVRNTVWLYFSLHAYTSTKTFFVSTTSDRAFCLRGEDVRSSFMNCSQKRCLIVLFFKKLFRKLIIKNDRFSANVAMESPILARRRCFFSVFRVSKTIFLLLLLMISPRKSSKMSKIFSRHLKTKKFKKN